MQYDEKRLIFSSILALIHHSDCYRVRHIRGGKIMNVSKVDGLLAEMRAAMVSAQGGGMPKIGDAAAGGAGAVAFASVLKSSLDGVAQAQNQATSLQNAFVLGDDKVSLSDTMIAMQKANISLQATVQVRNKVVAAYNDIMNMQV
jgi:flagellar hook-basal body complex protein FliE